MTTHWLRAGLLLSVSISAGLAPLGCIADSTETGDEDDLTQKTCAITSALTGKKMRSTTVAKLGDPVAKLILAGGTCPKSFAEVADKLRETDKEGCTGDVKAGLKARLVSERSQARGTPDTYRAVVTRTCNNRPVHGLFMSLFGLRAADKSLPSDVELIGFDEKSGSFNYYALEGGAWTFFGNSKDLIKEGAAEHTRCANCHVGGGLVMKELNSPWTHWEGDTDTPGAADYIGRFEDLGNRSNGIELESTVMAGNRVWNKARIEHLKANGTTADVLRPLFCTVEANLDSQMGSAGSLTSVPVDFLVDPAFSVFTSIAIDPKDYATALKANNQRVIDSSGKTLKGKDDKPVIDTFFGFLFPERAGIDADYVSQLESAGVVDDGFVKDVLVIDFTRPIFSDARCGLLASAPDLAAADMTPQKIRDGFIASLGSRSDAASKELLANLKNASDGSAHDQRVTKFVDACKARPKTEMVADLLKVGSARREKVRELPFMEFPESLPVDDLDVATSTTFDPVTCKLSQ